MKLRLAGVVVGFLSLALSLAQLTVAQISAQTASALPRLVRFGGAVKDLNGSPLTGVVGVTFALYSEQSGGAPLWLETQNATADSTGHYTVLLGSTKPDGLPAELFTSEQARWVGVQVSGQAEQPRVLLVSAPYALKAGDAETIGGLPPSAFVLAAPAAIGSASASSPNASTAQSVSPATTSDVTTTGGTASTIPMYTTATNIQNSILTQTAPTTVNVGGKLNLPSKAAATTTAGADSRPLDFVASSFSSTSSAAVNQTFQWQAEPAANDTTAPSGTLNLLYGLGATVPSETGLKLSSKGILTFATGQTFPGTGDGTVTSVATGLGLKGGPITKTGTLTIDTTVVPQLAVANKFTANQTVSGSVTATSSASGSIVGNTSDSAGTGVIGNATASTGGTTGVLGEASATSAVGVEGYASAATGNTVGVWGVALSPGGWGVYGKGATGVVALATWVTGPGGSFTGFSAASSSGQSGTDGVEGTGGRGDVNLGSTTGGVGVMGAGGFGGNDGGAGGSFSGGGREHGCLWRRH